MNTIQYAVYVEGFGYWCGIPYTSVEPICNKELTSRTKLYPTEEDAKKDADSLARAYRSLGIVAYPKQVHINYISEGE